MKREATFAREFIHLKLGYQTLGQNPMHSVETEEHSAILSVLP